jgi:hypothetical protein
MGQRLYSCAHTTASVRHAIAQSQESVSQLAARNGINPKTISRMPQWGTPYNGWNKSRFGSGEHAVRICVQRPPRTLRES